MLLVFGGENLIVPLCIFVCLCEMVEKTSTQNRIRTVFQKENIVFNNVHLRIVVQSTHTSEQFVHIRTLDLYFKL